MALTKKQKRNWIIAGIVFALIIIAVVLFNVIDFDGGGGLTLAISQVQETQEEVLDFCTNEQGCIDFLKEQGMPQGFLQENNLQINCLNNLCTIK